MPLSSSKEDDPEKEVVKMKDEVQAMTKEGSGLSAWEGKDEEGVQEDED